MSDPSDIAPGAEHGPGRRLARVREAAARAAERAGRSPVDVELVVVTKTHPAEALEELYAAGGRVVAENRVQEALQKMRALGEPDDLPDAPEGAAGAGRGARAGRFEWHFIGHIQRNKAAQVVGRFDLIHSIDSAKLIEELQRRAAAAGVVQRGLLELNLAGEASKTGASPAELPAMLAALAAAPNLRVEGLMTVPPHDPNPEKSRPHFKRLRALLGEIGARPGFEPRHLSMGMSGDFEVAIEEGATLIRVGSLIMGERS